MDKSRARILCVEDHPDTCSMIQTLLELEDYQVVSASTLQPAIDQLVSTIGSLLKETNED